MGVPRQLRDEFPEAVATIERLVRNDYEFGRLAADYDEVNHQIWRIESKARLTADEVLENLKKRRLLLRDDIVLALAREQRRA